MHLNRVGTNCIVNKEIVTTYILWASELQGQGESGMYLDCEQQLCGSIACIHAWFCVLWAGS